jgi:hypothetical protein
MSRENIKPCLVTNNNYRNNYDKIFKKKTKSQIHNEYCKKNGIPQFVPIDGICCSCNKDIFERANPESLVTGCPHCSRSFVD